MMSKPSTSVVIAVGVLLVALAVANSVNDPWAPAVEPCGANSDTCGDVSDFGADEDGAAGLSLIQRTAMKTVAPVIKEAALKALDKPRPPLTEAPGNGQLLQQNSAHEKVAASSKHHSRMAPVFFDVASMDYYQLTLVTLIYGYVLYVGSNMIGDGSELLCFFPSVAGIVGSVVVPILGAVPDGAMVLFSGLGPNAQSSVSTGVGALAGSTVMLLTVPWFIVNMAGSVPLKEDGTANYQRNKDAAGMFNSGVTFGPSVATNAKIMVITSLSFLIIQIPAFFVDRAGVSIAAQAKAENTAAGVGLLVSILLFFAYIAIMYMVGDEDTQLKVIIEGIQNKQVSLSTILCNMSAEEVEKNLPKILRSFFFEYDSDKSGFLEPKEFELVLKDLGESVTPVQAKALFDKQDNVQHDGKLSFDEFCQFAKSYDTHAIPRTQSKTTMPSYDDDDEEEELLPEDLADQPAEVQNRAMLIRSFTLMGFGTLLVLVFADPAVDVFTEWGDRVGVSSFYVGFLLAPFASNASELLVALGYARAKTAKKITMSFESLVGAACMNNTFCLAVFFALVYFENLAWVFKAETAGILIIQWLMAGIIFSCNTQRKVMGFAILSLYPLCLLIVWFLENVVGWD
jgi:Ca2+/Na+ antiporter